MVRASRNVSNARRAAPPPAASFEQVDTVLAGPGAGGPEYVEVRTGRTRRPASVQEWRQQRAAALRGLRAMPAAVAVVMLLEAEDADVKAVGRPLSEWERWGVLGELDRLAAAARQDYSPAAGMVAALRAAWVRQWGDREPVPPRAREVKRERRARVTSMASDPPDAERTAAAWAGVTAPVPPWRPMGA